MPQLPMIEVSELTAPVGVFLNVDRWKTPVVIGCSSQGEVGTVALITSQEDLESFGTGPGPRFCSTYMNKTGKGVLLIKVATEVDGTLSSTSRTTTTAGEATITFQGDPTDAYQFRIITTEGALGTAQYQLSLDAGRTWTSKATITGDIACGFGVSAVVDVADGKTFKTNLWSADSTAPTHSTSLTETFDALKASEEVFGVVLLLQPLDEDTMSSVMTAWEAVGERACLLCNFRPLAEESALEWKAAARSIAFSGLRSMRAMGETLQSDRFGNLNYRTTAECVVIWLAGSAQGSYQREWSDLEFPSVTQATAATYVEKDDYLTSRGWIVLRRWERGGPLYVACGVIPTSSTSTYFYVRQITDDVLYVIEGYAPNIVGKLVYTKDNKLTEKDQKVWSGRIRDQVMRLSGNALRDSAVDLSESYKDGDSVYVIVKATLYFATPVGRVSVSVSTKLGG